MNSEVQGKMQSAKGKVERVISRVDKTNVCKLFNDPMFR